MLNIAFLVGCSSYRARKLKDLGEGILADISLMRNSFKEYCACSDENIFIFSSFEGTYFEHNETSNPFHDDIIRTLKGKERFYKKKEINNLFFYYSGHGYISLNENAVLMPEDFIYDEDSEQYPERNFAILLETITDILRKKYDYKHLIVILDMCQEELRFKSAFSRGEKLEAHEFPHGTIVFYSCFPGMRSYMIPKESEVRLGKGSVFTNLFAKALQDEKCNLVYEIGRYIDDHIKDYTDDIRKTQIPYFVTQADSLRNVNIKTNIRSNEDKESEESHPEKNKTEEKTNKQKKKETLAYYYSERDIKRLNTYGIHLESKDLQDIYSLWSCINVDDINSITEYGCGILKDYNELVFDFYTNATEESFFKLFIKFKSYEEDFIKLIEPPLLKCSRGTETQRVFKYRQAIHSSVFTSKLGTIQKDLELAKDVFSQEIYNGNQVKKQLLLLKKELCKSIISGRIFIEKYPEADTAILNGRISFFEEERLKDFTTTEKNVLERLNRMFEYKQKCEGNYTRLQKTSSEIIHHPKMDVKQDYIYYSKKLQDILSVISDTKTALYYARII